MAAANIVNSLVSISQFNKGQASHIFDRLQTEERLIVLKNNKPAAVIISPEEYDRLMEIEEDNHLLAEACKRLQKSDDHLGTTMERTGIPMDEVLSDLGITDEDLDSVGDVVIE